MGNINILSPHVADLIAAGEVVERPASVIKELIENAFDAGAKNVFIDIRNGGMSQIRVSDNGCGMSPEDAGIAFVRHATSKLHDEFGLESISTMGFRGEALAAISSVSHMEILTRQRNCDTGTQVLLTAGDIDSLVPYGCPEGTTVIVKDLFYNTPARLKFMKSDRAEAASCVATALRCALGRPDVSVRFTKDGQEEFFSPGDGRLDSCIYSLLGRSEASTMLYCNSSLDNISVKGYISSPSECRGNRSHQYFFINGRCIKSVLLQSALEQAYKDALLSGRYPSCVLYLTLPFTDVDVNVHPAKTEVRFNSEKQIFDIVYSTCKLALSSEDRLAPVHGKIENAADDALKAAANTSPASDTFSVAFLEKQHVPENPQPVFNEPKEDFFAAPIEQYEQASFLDFSQCLQTPPKAEAATSAQPVIEKAESTSENLITVDTNSSAPKYNILGQAFSTYIIVEHNGEILLIDKHAAHERMIFDRLCSQKQDFASQMLLTQITIHLNPVDSETIESNGELLAELGFEIEPFGDNTYIVRAIPADMDASEVKSAIDEILEKLRLGAEIDPEERRREILHTVACKAAIKAGWDTHNLELQKIVDAVVSSEVKYCPHGRPVSVTVSRRDLDKLFKRIL